MLQLRITVPEKWDPVKEEFIYTPDVNVQLEHSLLSIAKWESHFHKPFLGTKLTGEEMLYYVSKCMLITKGVNEDIFETISRKNLDDISSYINDPMTATPKLPSDKPNGPEEVITNELIYYWMNEAKIPWDAERWHLNRLLKLIELTSYKNTPPEKRPKADMAKARREENARRRALWNTKG